MTVSEAFHIVLDLAEQNIIKDSELIEEKKKQLKAIEIVKAQVAYLDS